jgi:hypothetical protein
MKKVPYESNKSTQEKYIPFFKQKKRIFPSENRSDENNRFTKEMKKTIVILL